MAAKPVPATTLRTLSFGAAASIAICAMIGQGVFLKARVMTCNVGTPTAMLAAWALAGLLALCGALTLGELGAAIPESGGMYAFFERAYGEAIAFAYGWMVLFIGAPASIAALAVGAALFFNVASERALDHLTSTTVVAGAHLSVTGVQLAALALVAAVTAINCAPVVVNGRLATVLAALKIAMLASVTLAAFTLARGNAAHFASSGAAGSCVGVVASLRGGAAGFAAAVIGALYAYNGFNGLTWVAGEVKNPGRTLPAALVASVSLVGFLYIAANAGFVNVLSPLSIASLAPDRPVGIAVVETLFGSTWRTIAAAFLFASVAATLHVTMLTVARVTFALARGGLGIAALARLTPRGRVPVNAVLTNSVLACVLVVAGSFDALSNYFVFNAWVFYVAAGVAVFVLRRREPGMPRPYRTFGYPAVPVAYVAVGTWLVVQTALSSPGPSLIGLAIVAVSFPAYILRRSRSST
jgi:APA family basic amino acid/polyamine antiporter